VKVLAAIVTYNRKSLLLRCINHVLEQINEPDEVIVINNGSTDGTEKMLSDINIRHVNQENTGSSGGWEAAINIAVDENFDAVWLMDDDGFPGNKALSILKSKLTSGVACISSVVISENNHNKFVFPFPIFLKNGFRLPFFRTKKLKKIIQLSINDNYPFVHLFNGALVNVSAIQKIGNVNTDYFMYGDEVDYCYRLATVGTVMSAIDAKHYHPNVLNRKISKNAVGYLLRNSITINHLYRSFPVFRDFLTIVSVCFLLTRRNGIRNMFWYVLGGYKGVFYKSINKGTKCE